MDTSPGTSASAELRIHRAQVGVRDMFRAYNVELDGEVVAGIRRGQAVHQPVTPGAHTLRIGIDWATSPAYAVVLYPGGSADFECAPGGALFAGLSELRTDPAHYVRLELTNVDGGEATPTDSSAPAVPKAASAVLTLAGGRAWLPLRTRRVLAAIALIVGTVAFVSIVVPRFGVLLGAVVTVVYVLVTVGWWTVTSRRGRSA